MYAARILSLRPDWVAIRFLNCFLGTTRTAPPSVTRVVTKARNPVRRLSSPRNCPGPYRAMDWSSPLAAIVTSISPERTT